MKNDHLDVLIVGAGLSGIAAGYHLQNESPDRSYAILERREAIGGTWDLFRYPGIRSDSDMHTLGYSFRPWRSPKAIADGTSIREYVQDTARENGIDKKIRYGLKVVSASWSTPDARWTVEAERTESGEKVELTANFLFMCSGYYNYDQGYTPEFEGIADFGGRIVHPQKWTDDIDYANKKVVVIGSGATAVTLVPEMAKTAAHVTMLQRSPTYIVSMPSEDATANYLRSKLPEKIAYALTRWKNILSFSVIFRLCRRYPAAIKKKLLQQVRENLGEGHDIKRDFTPSYNPWDQRMCMVPDGDLFNAIKSGEASILTDKIDRFTETGLRLQSGKDLDADVVVTATGLNLLFLAGLQVKVDGEEIKLSDCLTYKGVMFSGLPNLAMTVGYTNASWTLKCDLTCEYVAKMLNYMRDHDHKQVCPRTDGSVIEDEDMLPLTSGYIQRSIKDFPKQGSREPWKSYQNYLRDIFMVRYGKLTDDALVFSSPDATEETADEELRSEGAAA
ncbi:MAG: NAD(P)/FAD-dependent oxidoreductase [Candidatus Binatia bacterium]|nr:NAD(P)/FAD-dependent oxidoreductase [Candidatus Binatia bacterium]HAC80032.1 FAD-containing monooxygenase EthA [Deltaproteobacteria bacterium]